MSMCGKDISRSTFLHDMAARLKVAMSSMYTPAGSLINKVQIFIRSQGFCFEPLCGYKESIALSWAEKSF